MSGQVISLKAERIRRREKRFGSGPCLGTPPPQDPVVGDEDPPLQNPESWKDQNVNG